MKLKHYKRLGAVIAATILATLVLGTRAIAADQAQASITSPRNLYAGDLLAWTPVTVQVANPHNATTANPAINLLTIVPPAPLSFACGAQPAGWSCAKSANGTSLILPK